MKIKTHPFALLPLVLAAACTSTDTAEAPPPVAAPDPAPVVAAVEPEPAAPPVEAAPAPAAEETSADGLPAARGIVDAFVDKTKIRKKLEESSSFYLTGNFEMVGMGMAGPMDVFQAKPNKMYFNMTMEGMGEVETGYDGNVGWQIHPMMGASVKEGIELYQLMMQADYYLPLKRAEDYVSMETVGREDFEGQECWVIECVRKPAEGIDAEETEKVRTFREYYSVETGLLVGTTGTQVSEMGEMDVKTVMSEYEEVEGQLMARKNSMEIMGMIFEMTFESVEYDTVEDEVFALPKQIQALVDDTEG